MNTENLYVNQRIKNYKELCKLLNIKIKAGNSKKSQLKDFECYFKYHKEGNTYIIDEIYDTPKCKMDLRSTSNNIYSKIIEVLILNMLAEEYKKGANKIFVSIGKMLNLLSFINANYIYGRENTHKLSNYLEMKEDIIIEFYQSTRTFQSSIENVLINLENKSLIKWSKILTTCKTIKVYNKNNDLINTEIHLPATDDELKFIIEAEREILNKLKFKDKRTVVITKQWKKFSTKVKEILKPLGIKYYYKSYKIIFSKYVTEELNNITEYLLSKDKRDKTLETINNLVINKSKKNALNRHERAIKMYQSVLGTPKEEISRIRKSDEYITYNTKLIDMLLNKSTPDLRNDMDRSWRIKQKEKIANVLTSINN